MTPAPITPMYRHRESGISLIEVLVTLLLLGVGLLGIAGLQLIGVQNTYLGQQYTQAATLAQNMAELMRTNRPGLLDNAYALAAGSAPPDPATDCQSDTCTPAELAAWQLASWYSMLVPADDLEYENVASSLEAALPQAQAEIRCADSPCTDTSYRLITVFWDANRSGASGTGCDPDDEDDLQCMQVVVRP